MVEIDFFVGFRTSTRWLQNAIQIEFPLLVAIKLKKNISFFEFGAPLKCRFTKMMKLSVASLTNNCERVAVRHQFCSNESYRVLLVLVAQGDAATAIVCSIVRFHFTMRLFTQLRQPLRCIIYGVRAPAPRWYAFTVNVLFRCHECALRHVDHIGDGRRATFFFRFNSRSVLCFVLLRH